MEEIKKSIFSMEAFLVPEQFVLLDYPRRPTSVFNPAAYVRQGKLVLLPRLIFDDRFYVSSIGLCEPISFEELDIFTSGKRTIRTRLLKYPQRLDEIDGIEDARMTEDGKKLLTVGINRKSNIAKTQTLLTNFNGKRLSDEKPFYFKNSTWQTGRDAVLLNEKVLFFRPEAKSLTSYRAFYELKSDIVFISSNGLKPILEARKEEKKRGFSTNAVKISSNEYLVGWHGVSEDTSYKNGFMLVDEEGLPLGITDYLLETTGFLQYGNRPFTLFGCGLIKLKDKLFWVGGVGDWAIGIFSADLGIALSKLKWL